MRTITIDYKQTNKKIDRVIREAFPQMPSSALFKAFRKKDIKVNGIRIKEDYITTQGDKVEIYIVDNILEGNPANNEGLLNKGFSIVFEDSNLMIVNKEQGIPVHPDRDRSTGTLIDSIQNYLAEKGEYIPGSPSSFPPALCHRLDRNTGGLVLIAKNERSLDILLEKIKNKEIEKYYQCLVKGKMESKQKELHAYLEKDERKSKVFIKDQPSKEALEIITRYRVLRYDEENDISRLEVELVTGRTHQIRAHLAHIGHPIIGDGKYGTNAINRPLGAKQQMLWATRLVFGFQDGKILTYLKGRTFEVAPGWKEL